MDDGKRPLFSSTIETISNKKQFVDVSIEDVKEYWDRRPCNINHSSAELASKEYFDEVEKKKYFVEPHIPEFAQFAKWKGKKVLELGCGLGTEAINFARAEADITVVDISSNSLNLCKKRFKVLGLKGEFYVGNIEHLTEFLPTGSKFDLVWAFGVIHHTPHPERVIAEIKKVIAVEGELRMMVYSRVSYKLFFLMKETGIWDFSKMNGLISEYAEAQTGCPVAYTFTFDEVRQLLTGFEITTLKKAHIFPYKIPEYKQNQYVKEDCWKDVSPELFSQLEAELGWHTLVIARQCL